MADEERKKVVEAHGGNSTEGGRYGSADPEKPHVAPEAPRVGIDDARVELPHALGGALPENARKPKEGDEE